MDQRFLAMTEWLRDDLRLNFSRLVPASADASFRRYFRLLVDKESYIVMDAPPDKEDCAPFVKIAKAFRDFGINVPLVHQSNLNQGFLLLSDLGENNYLSVLNDDNADLLYGDAISALLRMQDAGRESGLSLPVYDKQLLLTEMALFRDWLLLGHVKLELDDTEHAMLTSVFDLLVDNALEQPQVCVHRDYHSRNLMVCKTDNPGVLDFQDALVGPISYDLVSLLRDCYVEWPSEKQRQWLNVYCQGALALGLLDAKEACRFRQWFDLMGVQRHLKAAGIFARLYHRDGKDGYLNDIPNTLRYICRLGDDYPALRPLVALINQRVLPRLSRHAGDDRLVN